MLHPVRGTRSPPPVEVGDIGHRVISPKVFMENAPAFSFIGLSTRVEIYAPPDQRHTVPATYRSGGYIGHRVMIPFSTI